MLSRCALSSRQGWRGCAGTLQQSRSVTIGMVGGSGFVGCRTAVRLCENGYNVRIISRHPHHIQRQVKNEDLTIEEGFSRAADVRRLGVVKAKLKEGLKRVESTMRDDSVVKLFMEFNVVNAGRKGDEDLRSALTGCDGVINCMGILSEGLRRGSFDGVHHHAAANVAAISREVGVKRLVQISAVGASADSPSRYAQSKARGEEAVAREFPGATILRPSLVVGRGDGFFTRFNRMARCSPFLPLIGGGATRFQPVHVDDVAEACISVLTSGITQGKTYELGGPDVYTFRELLQKMLVFDDRRRLLVPVPTAVAYAQATLLQLLPMKLLTVDQVRMLQRDNVVSPSALALKDLGMTDLLNVEDALEDIFRYRHER